jgi:uncharacterized protein
MNEPPMDEMTVSELWCYPLKSAQGHPVDRAVLTTEGIVGDRRWALIDSATGKLMSAKRWSALLMASARASDGQLSITLPDGQRIDGDDPAASTALSAWLGRPVELREVTPDVLVAYEMTFDPPNDDAELFDIPAPAGSFLDLAAVHLLASATIDHAAKRFPELEWDVRRFRPNVVVDGSVDPFGEDAWSGRKVTMGGVTLAIRQPTVRCAMPLRAQPGLSRQRGLYDALEVLHANHLGVYADVVETGVVQVGDSVVVEDD